MEAIICRREIWRRRGEVHRGCRGDIGLGGDHLEPEGLRALTLTLALTLALALPLPLARTLTLTLPLRLSLTLTLNLAWKRKDSEPSGASDPKASGGSSVAWLGKGQG